MSIRSRTRSDAYDRADPGYDRSDTGYGGYSSGYGYGKEECCPLVVDPLTLLALIGGIAAATFFLNTLITMNIMARKKKRKRRSWTVDDGLHEDLAADDEEEYGSTGPSSVGAILLDIVSSGTTCLLA